MVEWYRRDADYQQIATDVEQLVAHVASTYSGHLTVQDPHGVSVDLTPPWPQWTIADAMAEFAGIHLPPPDDATGLHAAAVAAGMSSINPEDDWETAFYKIAGAHGPRCAPSRLAGADGCSVPTEPEQSICGGTSGIIRRRA